MWYKATDKLLNSYVRVEMLDFSKAIDPINHLLLLDKLQSYGLQVRWMATLDLAQRLKTGNYYSNSCHPNGGVPERTESEHKCFLVYITDLRMTVPLYKYVEDSMLFEICDRKDATVIQESLDIGARWTEQNDMKINSEKSKEVIISFAQGVHFRSTIPNIKIDGRQIAHVCHAGLLGMTISQDLTWNKDVENIVTKCVNMLYQLKHAGITCVYVSVVRPVLESACPGWHTNLPQ